MERVPDAYYPNGILDRKAATYQGLHGKEDAPFHLTLVGNANVGKSVIFNQLTGLNQFVGNWPGKTVTWAEGNAYFNGAHFKIADLPGIYSLSTYSLEEIVSREHIVDKPPDFLVNVVDSTNLERNLFFTIQLLLLDAAPVIVVLNQWDLARSKGLDIDIARLGQILGCPVIPAVAVHGRGVHEILEVVMAYEDHTDQIVPPEIRFGKEVEERLNKIEALIQDFDSKYPARFAALKLLERDEEMLQYYNELDESVIFEINKIAQELEDIHGENSAAIVAAEIYNIVHNIVFQVQQIEHKIEKPSLADRLDHVTTHSVWGYVILAAVLFGMYWTVFTVGGWIADLIDALYGWLSEFVYEAWGADATAVRVLWDGGFGGFMGAVGGVLPFVFMFYFLMEILQDSGYLPRAAFLMDQFMHRVGLHGKSIIPIILGFGCNVPGCTACRILETEREKRLSMYTTSMVPCAAVTTVVMGLVGRYLGIWWAFLLYVVNFVIIIILGRIAYVVAKGENTELIIELHDFRKPNMNVIAKQTWFRGKEFVVKALPLIVVVGILMEILYIFDLLAPLNQALAPVTVFWLGLPIGVGVFLLYGILRKELTLLLLVNFAAGMGLAVNEYLSPLQMIIFALVTMLYVPCLATIIVMAKEAGWKFALLVTIAEIAAALLVGGIIHWIHELYLLSMP